VHGYLGDLGFGQAAVMLAADIQYYLQDGAHDIAEVLLAALETFKSRGAGSLGGGAGALLGLGKVMERYAGTDGVFHEIQDTAAISSLYW
jgi:hypothetical protein